MSTRCLLLVRGCGDGTHIPGGAAYPGIVERCVDIDARRGASRTRAIPA
ncbi:hypothetical protein [Mycobacterium innocens]|nr:MULTISPECIES: hypothetical protein [Mycobacterium]